MPRRHGERGEVALQTAIITPAVLGLLAIITQAGLWFYACNVATAAAEEGARASAVQGGSAGAGKAAAEDFAVRVGAPLLQGVTVSATRSANTTTVVVSGHSTSLVPWVPTGLSQAATLPVERTT